LTGRDQPLGQECTLHDVAAVVFARGIGERYRPGRAVVDPVGPHAVETVAAGQEIRDLRQTLHAFAAGDETPLDADDDSGDAESRTAHGDRVQVPLGIVLNHADPRESRVGQRAFPNVVKILLLDVCQKIIVVIERPFSLITRVVGGGGRECGRQKRDGANQVSDHVVELWF